MEAQLDPVFDAHSRFRRRDFDGAIEICTRLLVANPYDQAVWFLKCRAITEKSFVDDSDFDEEGIAEVLLDDNAISQAPRPGTSLNRPTTSAGRAGTALDAAMRPMTASGRPVTGFARPGTSGVRPTTASGRSQVETAFRGARPGTSRAMTALGRAVRLGTASMISTPGGPFINLDRLDLRKYGARPAIAKALFDYIWHVEHNPRKGMELAAAATVAAGYDDWWWKLRLGKCYYQLGMLRDAERQFKSSLKAQEHVSTFLELGKLYSKLDQPAVAQETYVAGADVFSGDTHLLLASARLHEAMGSGGSAAEQATLLYRRVLALDAVNAEALSCLAAQHFYADQPEVALKYYRRLLQMGAAGTELWNNLGLCCFYAGQYDMTLACFDRALAGADDAALAEVWGNVGTVAVGLGDLGLAYQAFRCAVAADACHAESYNSLGVLEMRKGNVEAARANFATASKLADHLYEPLYNGALLAYKLGDFAEAFALVTRSLAAFPEAADALDLLKTLRQSFIQL